MAGRDLDLIDRGFVVATAKLASDATGVDWRSVLYGRSRTKTIAMARTVTMYLLRLRGYSHVQIGTAMKRDHTSVGHAIKRAADSKEALAIVERIGAWEHGEANWLIQKAAI